MRRWGGEGGEAFVKKLFKTIYSDPALWVAKSRRAVADRSYKQHSLNVISLYLMSASSFM